MILVTWLKWQVQMGSLSKVAVPLPYMIWPLEASRGPWRPQSAKHGHFRPNLYFRTSQKSKSGHTVEMAGPDGFPEQSCLSNVHTFFASRGL